MARSKPTNPTAPSGKAGRAPAATPGKRARSGAPNPGLPPEPGVKLNRKGQPKKRRLARFGRQVKMIGQAYTMTRRNDPKLPWILLITFVLTFTVVELLGILFGSPFLFLPLALVLALLITLIVFGRRAQGTAYKQVEGQPGAAAWVLDGMRGNWKVDSGVAGTPQLDAVHRVVGRPGVVLVAEGSPNRVRGLLAQEKKRLARVVGDTPIYDVTVGDGEGQVPLRGLDRHFARLPRNGKPKDVNVLDRKLKAMPTGLPIPKGPIPGGGRMPRGGKVR